MKCIKLVLCLSFVITEFCVVSFLSHILNKILQHLSLILFYFFILNELDNLLNNWEEIALLICYTCIMKLTWSTKLTLSHSGLHMF